MAEEPKQIESLLSFPSVAIKAKGREEFMNEISKAIDLLFLEETGEVELQAIVYSIISK